MDVIVLPWATNKLSQRYTQSLHCTRRTDKTRRDLTVVKNQAMLTYVVMSIGLSIVSVYLSLLP